MKRIGWFILFGALVACFSHDGKAQPTQCFVGQTNAGCPTDGTQSPDIKTHIGGLNSSYATIAAGYSSLPQPKITNGVMIVPANSLWMDSDSSTCYTPSNACFFSTAGASSNSKGINAYIDAMPAGISAVDIQIDPLIYTEVSEYAGACTPSNPAFKTWQYQQLDLVFAHIKAKSLSIRLAPSPLGATYTSCGLTPSTMSSTDASGAVNPMFAAMVAHLNANSITIADFTAWHEPLGVTQIIIGQTFTPTQWSAMITSACTAIHAAAGGSGINCGGGFTFGEGSYVSNFVSNVAGANFLGVDVYGPVLASGFASAMPTYQSFMASAIAGGFTAKVNESNPPFHVPATAPSNSDQYSYEGCIDQIWETYGANNAFAQTMVRWASAYGAKYFTRYATQPFAGLSTNATLNCRDNGTAQGTGVVIGATTGVTIAGTGWQASTAFPASSIQGFAKLTGNVSLH